MTQTQQRKKKESVVDESFCNIQTGIKEQRGNENTNKKQHKPLWHFIISPLKDETQVLQPSTRKLHKDPGI